MGYVMNVLSNEKRARVIRCLVEGNSIRATHRITGVARNTIAKLLSRVGLGCGAYQDEAMNNISSKRIQADEIWSFCGMKEKRVPKEQKGQPGYGDAYTWVAFDPDSKLVPGYWLGRRDTEDATIFMKDLSKRLNKRIQLTTDGHQPYIPAVKEAFGDEIDFAMVKKEYGGTRVLKDGTTKKFRSSECSNIIKEVICGNPDPKHISTSLVERQNLTMRMSMRRFTRKTNGFSKIPWYLECAIHLHFMYYNFARKHQSLKGITPAMAAGVTDHVWSLEEIANLALFLPPLKIRGPYKKLGDHLQEAA